ncbi:MAG TPA: hypothetical protein VK804_23890 [Bradyrhizobium sp.]|uniref:hypothetical protein n=1 Tax=Bradyrhizobium sp. TaxID=376 RepID=UPI002CD881B7|nr:hypothetical protein [Bradyrhizobium sp.]HTB03523.1 hypothetical protein [Bradyrhizobium sp.]
MDALPRERSAARPRVRGGLIEKPSSAGHADSAGELYWGGLAGTQWWISPRAGVAGVMMAQRHMGFFHPFAFQFKQLAYEAVKRGG